MGSELSVMADSAELSAAELSFTELSEAEAAAEAVDAELVNISVPHMSHIETGSTKLSLPVLVDLSRALKVGADDLLNGVNSINRERMYGEIADILEQCSYTELSIMKEILLGTKNALKKYIK